MVLGWRWKNLVCNEKCCQEDRWSPIQFCERWAHPKCVLNKISVENLKALAEQLGITWTCTRCRTLSMKLQKQLQALNRNQQLMD